jgi:hypothetical protein
MRPIVVLPIAALATLVGMSMSACGGSNNQSGFEGSSSSGGGSSGSSGGSGGGSGSSSGGINNGDGGLLTGDGASNQPWDAEAGTTVHTTVYAHTDDTLYTVDPMTEAATMIGAFTGLPVTDAGAPPVTDLAVDGTGAVYVNTESAVYKATLPSGGSGPVALSLVATIGATGVYFYALAFAPVGAVDPHNEVLIGGDSKGNLWSIDPSGAATNLGGFGADPFTTGNIFELSGDIVFYIDPSTNKATGLATIRSCPSTGSSSKCGNDWLAGVNMTALASAYSTKTAAATLLGGIYGGSSTAAGPGTGYHDVFGLGAWGNGTSAKIFGFTRNYKTTMAPPTLITIDTTSGVGTAVPGASFSFTNGWSGAGVTTKITISVPPPPPPPAQ